MALLNFIFGVFILPLQPLALSSSQNEIRSILSAKERKKIDIILANQEQDFSIILAANAEKLLGRPYKIGPLGEGAASAIDPDPLYRLDAFDCTTLLETLLANAYCHISTENNMPECLANKMKKIRYREAKIDFTSRNHIPELDWLPNNVRAGYLREITQTLFPEAVKTVEFKFNRDEWLLTQGAKSLATHSEKTQKKKINYLPISAFFKPLEDIKLVEELRAKQAQDLAVLPAQSHEREIFRIEMEFLKKTQQPHEENLRKIPSGTIINLLRGKTGTNIENAQTTTLIIHQGLILQGPEGPEIIHAAPNLGHVSKQKLEKYLLRYVKSSKARGISLYQAMPPPLTKRNTKI